MNKFQPSLFFQLLAYVLILNTLIAAFLYYIGIYPDFFETLIYSQSIGLPIFLAVALSTSCLQNQNTGWFKYALSIAVGTIIGSCLAFILTGSELDINAILHSDKFYQATGFGVLFGITISYFFWSHYKILAVKEELHQKQIHLLESEKKLIESRLDTLQEQIEPHFLFNTLSNILSLVKMDPQRGHAMLERFIDYLRGSLNATRGQTITLGEEIDIVSAYLDVIQFRMGDRLQFEIDIPEELSQVKIPPMLIQPFVENSTKHGLEPKVEGGNIRLTAEKDNTSIKIIIEDTGLGIQNRSNVQNDSDHVGIGLSNTSERLALFSNKQADIQIEENQPEGTRVIITLPINQVHD